MHTVESIVDNLDLDLVAKYYSCDSKSIHNRLIADGKHLLLLMQNHGLEPKSGDRIISIGCGLSEELIALLVLYADLDFSYSAVDISSDYIFLCQQVFRNYTKRISFIQANAANLAFRKKHANRYNLIFFRHPYFMEEDNEQFSDFKAIAGKTIPALRTLPWARLFCSFYEEGEAERFLDFLPAEISPSNTKERIIEDKHEEYRFNDPSMGGKAVYTDSYSIYLPLKYRNK